MPLSPSAGSPDHTYPANSHPAAPMGAATLTSRRVADERSKQSPTSGQPTPLPESGETGSNWLNQAPAEKICHGVSRSCWPCRAFARAESNFCIFHDPAYRESQRANSAAGGRRSGEARARRSQEIVPLDLSTPRARLHVLGYVLAATLSGRYSAAHAAAINRVLAIATRNQDDYRRIDVELLAQFLPR